MIYLGAKEFEPATMHEYICGVNEILRGRINHCVSHCLGLIRGLHEHGVRSWNFILDSHLQHHLCTASEQQATQSKIYIQARKGASYGVKTLDFRHNAITPRLLNLNRGEYKC